MTDQHNPAEGRRLKDEDLENDIVASFITINMARGLAVAHGDFALDENLYKAFKTVKALGDHALTLESRVEELEKDLDNKRWQQAAKESREKYPRSQS